MNKSLTLKVAMVSCFGLIGNHCFSQDRALHFEEATNNGNYVNLNSMANLLRQNRDDFTVEFTYEKPSTPQSGQNLILFGVNSADATQDQNRLLLGIDNIGRISLSYNAGGGAVSYSNSTISSGCHRIVLTRDDSDTRVYVDGTELTGLDNNGSSLNSTLRVSLGQEWDANQSSQHLGGTIDDFMFFDRTKSSAEISSNFLNPNFSPNQAGLRVYYDFDQGIANGNNSGQTTLINRTSTGSQYNGSLAGFSLNGNTSNFTFDPCAEIVFCCDGKPNLMENGDFEDTTSSNDPIPQPVGFSSDYSDAISIYRPGAYMVTGSQTTNAFNPTWNVKDYFACQYGKPYDRFMIVNGATQQPIGSRAKIFGNSVDDLELNADYSFCMVAKELEACFNGLLTNPSIAINVIGGVWDPAGGYDGGKVFINTADTPCDWQTISGKFKATASVVIIEIYLYEDMIGDINDIAIDNIAVQACFGGGIVVADPDTELGKVGGISQEPNSMTTYPNPFTNMVDVELEDEGPIKFRVLTLNGEVIKSGNSTENNFNIDLSDFNERLLIIEVEQNGIVCRKRILRQID